MSESANDMPSAPTALALKDTSPAQAPAKPVKYERKLRVTAKVRSAIEQMVWHGLKRADAAQTAGLTDHSLYVALRSPHVKAHYLSECEVLRTSGRARRIHRLEQMSEQDENKAAVVNAIRALELMGNDEQVQRGAASTPGMIIIINGSHGAGPLTTQTHVPDTKTIEHE